MCINKLNYFKNHFFSCVYKNTLINGHFVRLAIPCNTISTKCRFYSIYYNKIDEEASKLCVHLDSNYVINILKDFTSSKHNVSVLSKIFSKLNINEANELDIHKCLLLLQVCNRLKLKDLDLVSPVSVVLSFLYSKILSGSNEIVFNDLKSLSLAMCRIYNELKLLYDPLFLLLSNRFSNELEKFEWEELSLLLLTYSYQRYNGPEIIKNICDQIENANLEKLESNLAVSMYSSLSYLEYLSPNIKRKLESVFMELGDKLHTFDPGIKMEKVLDVAYSNLLIDAPSINDMEIVLSCLARIASLYKSEDLSTGFLRKFTVVVSYLKCLHRDIYDKLDEETKKKIMDILMKYNEHKKFENTIFVEKVSEHLNRMRIGNYVNIYKNGVLLDIVEHDQNLVWLCNSYHRFYATTFNMTANSKLMTKLIKAFGYKLAIINYYQWGRMKCKRTRYAFLRMARYYALKDKREYDPKYSGWSLPYIWWNYTARDRLHISHYDHYNP